MRVLVVETQKGEAAALKRTLHAEGFTVDIALAPAAADGLVRAVKFDLIVLGLQLAGADSFALLRGWRVQGVHTPILALAAADHLADKIRALEFGADDAKEAEG